MITDMRPRKMTTEDWFRSALLDGATQAKVKDTQPQIEALDKAIKAIDRKLSRVADAYIDGAFELDAYKAKKAALLDEKTALMSKRSALDTKAPEPPNPAAIGAFVDGLVFDPAWDAGTKRAWVKKHVRTITVSRGGVEKVQVQLPASDDDTLAVRVNEFETANSRF